MDSQVLLYVLRRQRQRMVLMHVYYGTFGSSRAQRLDKDFGLLPPHGPGLTQPSIRKWSVNRVPVCRAGVEAGCVRL